MTPVQTPADPYASYGERRGWSGADRPSSADAAMFLQVLGNDVGPGKRLLDIGFGSGRLLTWVKRQGGHASGVELQASLIAGARSAGFQAEESIECFPHEAFDAITAFDVLEHVERSSLPSLVRSLVDRLRPGGRLIARIPNCQVPAGLAIQFSDHTHFTPLSEPIVKWLFRESGLAAVTVLGAPETIGADANLRARLQFSLLPLRQTVRRVALRIVGVPKGVQTAHNLIATGTKPVSRHDGHCS